MPKVSVIIPTYNRAHYVCETIQSVLAQTYTDYEIIVLDDGSTDTTRQVLEEYGDKIKYHYQENQGTPRAMNNGVRLSCGEYFAVLGDDDIWMPEMLQKQVQALEDNPNLAFVCSGAYLIDGNGTIIRQSTDGRNHKTTFQDLLRDNFVFHLTALVRRECFDSVGGFDAEATTTQDYDLWLRLTKKYEFSYTDEPLAKWRKHGGNLSGKLDLHLRDHLAMLKKKEIIGDMGFIEIQINVARIYYKFGGHYSRENHFWKAAGCFLKSVIYYPLIGVYFWPPETERFKFSLLYRLVHPYLLPLVYGLRALKRKRKNVDA